MTRRDLPRGDTFLTRDPEFYKTFFPLLGVITLQQLAQITVNLVDNIMLGRYTELALSGATLVNQYQFVLLMVISGIGMGLGVLGSQYWGLRQTEPIRRVISVAVKFALGAGLLFWAFGWFFPETALRIYTNDAAVIAEGVRYLRIMSWTYIIFALSFTLMYSLQCVETAFIGTLMSISTIIINICLNYCLIYGNFGFPELGVRGAAVATVTSRCAELLIVMVYLLCFDKKLRLRSRDIFGFDWGYLRDFLRSAAPSMITGFLWGVGQSAQTAILGRLSATVIAANAIGSVVAHLFMSLANAGASSASVTMGKTVGSGSLALVRPYARTLQVIFLCIGVLTGGGLFLARDAVISLYAVSPETAEMARNFLTVLSVSIVGSCYEFPVQGGIIAGGGTPQYSALCDNCFMWLFTIPASALAAFVFHAPPVVVFALLKADQLLKCIPNSIVCARCRWVKVLTR